VVWAKAGWAVLTRLSYWTAGPPFLSLAGDVIAAPGATKYVCRLLVYSEARKAVGRLRELVHRGALLAGADIEGGRVVTLSTSASGAATQRTLTLWTLADGQCVHTVEVEGGRGGLPVLRFPHALLPTAGVGLQVWHLPTSTQVRAVPVNVLSYRVRKQFVFVLNKPSQVTTVVSISSYKLFYLTVDKGLPPERVDQWQQQRADLVAGARLASAAGNGSRGEPGAELCGAGATAGAGWPRCYRPQHEEIPAPQNHRRQT